MIENLNFFQHSLALLVYCRPTVGQYAENQRISAVRKIYQRGVVTPMVNIEQLWAEYCAYEKVKCRGILAGFC